MTSVSLSGRTTAARRWLLSLLATRPGRRLLNASLIAALALNLGGPAWAGGMGTQGNLPLEGRWPELRGTQESWLASTNPQSPISNLQSPKVSPLADPYSNPAVQNALNQLSLPLPGEQLAVSSEPLAVGRSQLTPSSALLAPDIAEQFQVNSYTTNAQTRPAVAMDSDGDFVVVWQSDGGSGDTNLSIQGQRYNSAGTVQGSQFQVNSYTTNAQSRPAVAMDSDGDFVVVWQSYGSSGGAGTDFNNSIQGQRYNSVGSPLGSQFQVNSYTTNAQQYPAVGMDSDGDFVVVWASQGSFGSDISAYSIQARRYNAAGTAQGIEFQANSETTFIQTFPAVSLDSDGDFVVAWYSNGNLTDTSGSVQAQRFNSAGTMQGSQFLVNSYTTGIQINPDVALDSDGDFVIVWMSNGGSGTDGVGSYSIQGRRFNAAGVALGSDSQLNIYPTGDQRYPDVALDSDGDFVVVWESVGSYSSDTNLRSIQGRVFNENGLPLWGEFQVNQYTSNEQRIPAVALDTNGDFIVAWQSIGSSTGSSIDTDGYSIQAGRFDLGQIDHQVNSYTTGNQRYPDVAIDSDGDFVVVWYSYGSSGPPGTDTDSTSIQGQRYDKNGLPQGSQFQVNSYTTNLQLEPVVAMDSDGDFVVVWTSLGSSGGETDLSIQGQRYNSAGTAQGSQFQVNNYTTNQQLYPDVALDSDGDFVVVWTSFGSSGGDTEFRSIQARRYNAAGTAQANQFQVNTFSNFSQRFPAVSLDSDGDFVVVWDSSGSGGTDNNLLSIQGQRYNSAGTVQGSEFQVNSYTTGNQRYPDVSLDSDGDFVVVWQSSNSLFGDSGSYSIQVRRYNSTGTAASIELQVNSYTTNNQRRPAVSRDSSGNFVIAWESNGSLDSDTGGATNYSIQARRYNSAGAGQGRQFQVNNYTTNNQQRPAVALDSDGDFVIVWESNGLTSSSFAMLGDLSSRPAGFLAPEADSNYAIAAARFTAFAGPEPTALTAHTAPFTLHAPRSSPPSSPS